MLGAWSEAVTNESKEDTFHLNERSEPACPYFIE